MSATYIRDERVTSDERTLFDGALRERYERALRERRLSDVAER